MRLLVAMEDAILIADRRRDGFDARLALEDRATQSLASDPSNPARLYCGTFDAGLWRSDDSGETWAPLPALADRHVTAVAVSPTESANGSGVVFAGTEPSTVFRSEDGGETWWECAGLAQLPSAAKWSFPPRPHTHHVRWITPDPVVPRRLYVAIEAGALVRSVDGGASWLDRVADGPYDTHTLAATAHAPDHLHSAAGDGYFESTDGGASWAQPDDGLAHRYLWSVAVDPRGSGVVVVSAASGPWAAHRANDAESYLYRRANGEAWKRVEEGLPPGRGTTAGVVAPGDSGAGSFFAVSNHGVFRSTDDGTSWERLALTWPDRFRRQRACALIVQEAR